MTRKEKFFVNQKQHLHFSFHHELPRNHLFEKLNLVGNRHFAIFGRYSSWLDLSNKYKIPFPALKLLGQLVSYIGDSKQSQKWYQVCRLVKSEIFSVFHSSNTNVLALSKLCHGKLLNKQKSYSVSSSTSTIVCECFRSFPECVISLGPTNILKASIFFLVLLNFFCHNIAHSMNQLVSIAPSY